MRDRHLAQLEERLAERAPAGAFTSAELEGLPPPVRRYLEAAITHGASLAESVRLHMRGRIKIGRWWAFRAREVLNPLKGFVWRARAAVVITGSDRYFDGAGVLDWKLAKLVTVAHAERADVTRSAAGRAGAEAMWLPTALLPRFGVAWSAQNDHQVTARYRVGQTPLEVRFRLDRAGHIASLVFDRWGDPNNTGTWAWHPFGGEVTGYRSFGAVTIPSAGRFGWFYGTDRWVDGEFFRYRITALRLPNDATQ